jgi:uncharacterized BrkB/YihY/UPF0761 family membrane protein
MSPKTKKIIALFWSLSLFAVLAFGSLSTAWAQNPVPPGSYGMEQVGSKFGTGDPSDPKQDLRLIIVRIINSTLLVLGLIFVILLLVSGYQWMTAGGNKEHVETATKRMVNATIGLLIILAAWGITRFIFYKMAIPATTGRYIYY